MARRINKLSVNHFPPRQRALHRFIIDDGTHRKTASHSQDIGAPHELHYEASDRKKHNFYIQLSGGA